MRHGLQLIDGVRTRFRSTFKRFGKKSGYKKRWVLTILLVDVKIAGDENVLCDHVWMTAGKQFKDLDLHSGDIIEFNARVGAYRKGYSMDDLERPFRIDYRLERPTKMEKKGKATGDFSACEEESQNIRKEVEGDDLGLPPVSGTGTGYLTTRQRVETANDIDGTGSVTSHVPRSRAKKKNLIDFIENRVKKT